MAYASWISHRRARPGADDVLRHVARHVRARAIDLRRVLAAEAAATVPRHAAVGVDDDLAPREARVAHRPSDHEAPGRVDEVARAAVEQVGRDRRPRRRARALRPRGRQLDLGIVLGADEDGMDAGRPAIGVVLDGDLALSVGTQERQGSVLSHLRQPARDSVSENDRHRHELVGLVAGVAEHHSLVAGPELVVLDSLARLEGVVDALRDVGRLLLDRRHACRTSPSRSRGGCRCSRSRGPSGARRPGRRRSAWYSPRQGRGRGRWL